MANTRCLLVASVGLAALVVATSAQAGSGAFDFDLAAQPLVDSLRAVGRKTGENVVVASPLVSGRRAAPLKGEYTADEALERLLAGSGLESRRADGRSVVIVEPEQRPAAISPVGPIAMAQADIGRPQSDSGPADAAPLTTAAASPPPSSPPPPPSETGLSEIVVTGSRIRGVAAVGSPVVTLSQAAIQGNTAVTLADSLKKLPQLVSYGIDETSTASTAAVTNANRQSGLNIRGLSPQATLVLVEGQRQVGSGQTAAFVDPSVIPTGAIERVEVATDGSSAVYGSDAIAGVVNIILRKNFTGAESSVKYSFAEGFSRWSFNQIVGAGWKGGHVMFDYEHTQNGHLSSDERSFFKQDQRDRGGTDFRVLTCNPGTITIAGVNYAIPASPAGTGPSPASLVPGTRNLCDTSSSDIIGGRKKDTGLIYATQRLSDRISVYGRAHYSTTKIDVRYSTGGGTATTFNLNVPRSNAFFVAPAGTNPASETVGYWFYPQFGGIAEVGFITTWNAYTGVKVELPANWQMTVSTGGGGEVDHTMFDHTVDNTALAAALASSNPATALDPYGLRTSPQTLTAIMSGLQHQPSRQGIWTAEARADGPVMQLPGGVMRLAVGAESRREWKWGGTVLGSESVPIQTYFSNARTIKSVYGEAYVPLFGPENAQPGVQRLDLSLAVRYDHYSNTGGTTNPKAGLIWQPVEGLRLRTSYGKSFRAPTLTDIKAPNQSIIIGTAQSPTGTENGITIRGGRPDLEPEKAKTWAAGFDLNPNFLRGFSATVDWFSIDYRNRLLNILGTNLGNVNIYPNLITLNPTQAQIDAVLALGYPYNGTNVLPPVVRYIIDARIQNLGNTRAAGVDFRLAYQWKTASLGAFEISEAGSYFYRYKTQNAAALPYVDRLNTIGNPLRLKTITTVSWSKGGADIGLRYNYFNNYADATFTPVRKIKAYKTVDLHAAYRIEDGHSLASGVVVAVDVSDLFDTKPPFVNSISGYDPGVASPYNRMVALSFTKSF